MKAAIRVCAGETSAAEENAQYYTGECEYAEGSLRLTFKDTEIIFSDKSVRVRRSGEAEYELVFRDGEDFRAEIRTAYGVLETVLTKIRLKMRFSERDADAEAVYLQDGEPRVLEIRARGV